jgi:hypothetical protein
MLSHGKPKLRAAIQQTSQAVPARISFADLMATARSFPQEVRDDPAFFRPALV